MQWYTSRPLYPLLCHLELGEARRHKEIDEVAEVDGGEGIVAFACLAASLCFHGSGERFTPHAFSLADALLLEVVVVVVRKVSRLVVLFRLVAVRLVGEVVRDIALICEQHQMHTR